MIRGKLDPFFETGTEGVLWAVVDDEKPNDYTGLHVLRDWDYLRVFDADGKMVWEGDVALEWTRRYTPFPNNPEWGQQEVFGYWVHGFQRTLEPEVWAQMFFDGLPAELIPIKERQGAP